MAALFPQELTHAHIRIQINQNQTQKKKSLLYKGHRLFLFPVLHNAATLKAPSSTESVFRKALLPDMALEFKIRRALAWVCEGFFFSLLFLCEHMILSALFVRGIALLFFLLLRISCRWFSHDVLLLLRRLTDDLRRQMCKIILDRLSNLM